MSGHMGFVGVSTASSSIMRVFPVWADLLGLPTRELIGHDLPVDATPEQYRALVEAIRDDPDHLGALVTTHKMALYAAAHDLFGSFDDFALACGEVSSIAKRDGVLVGHAKDPITAGLAAEEFLAPDHFATTGGAAIVLGAGGAGTALSWYLAERGDRPASVVVVDTSAERLGHLREVHERHGTPDGLIQYADAADARTIVTGAPEGSFVVNASGLGKDRPGTPLDPAVPFPQRSVVWEFNYRGSLEFLHDAEAQAAERDLTVVDGWRYFIHGWTQVIGEVFQVPMTPEVVAELADAAESVR